MTLNMNGWGFLTVLTVCLTVTVLTMVFVVFVLDRDKATKSDD